MTGAPQKEYIITGQQIWDIYHDGYNRVGYYFNKTIEEVCSREYDPAAIQKERERVLDNLKAWTRGNSETIEADDGTLEDAVFLGDLLAKIAELRQQPQEPEAHGK